MSPTIIPAGPPPTTQQSVRNRSTLTGLHDRCQTTSGERSRGLHARRLLRHADVITFPLSRDEARYLVRQLERLAEEMPHELTRAGDRERLDDIRRRLEIAIADEGEDTEVSTPIAP
jgi:hypothetical protein